MASLIDLFKGSPYENDLGRNPNPSYELPLPGGQTAPKTLLLNYESNPDLEDVRKIQSAEKPAGLVQDVIADAKNFAAQELKGIRVKSLVDANNPLIYGNEAIRIMNRSTPTLEAMRSAQSPEGGGGGLLGKGLSKLTGGKVTSMAQATGAVNDLLGIPQSPIPSRIIGPLKEGKSIDEAIKSTEGTGFGKFLKDTGGGSPAAIGKQAVGDGIKKAKDLARKALFGSPTEASTTPGKTISFDGTPNGDYLGKGSIYTDYANEVYKPTEEIGSPDTLNEQYGTRFADIKPIDLATYSPIYGVQRGSKTDDSDVGFRTKNNWTYNQNADGLTNFDPNRKYSDFIYDTFWSQPDLDTADGLKGQYEKYFEHSVKQGSYNFRGGAEGVDITKYSPIFGTEGGSALDQTTLGSLIKKPEWYTNYIPDGLTNYDTKRTYSETGKDVGGEKVKEWSLEAKRGISNIKDTLTYTQYAKDTQANLEALDLIPFWIGRYGNTDKIHFRSILTGISETVSPTWNSNKFFGNPYNFYTYSSIERSVNMTLNIFCSNELELNNNWQKISELTKLAYPTINETNLVIPPIISFRLGDIYNDKIAYIESLTYTLPDNGTWEIDPDFGLLPKFIDVSLTFKFIEQVGSEKRLYALKLSKAAEFANRKPVDGVGTSPVAGIAAVGGNTKPTAPIQLTGVPSVTPVGDTTGIGTETALQEQQKVEAAQLGLNGLETKFDLPQPLRVPEQLPFETLQRGRAALAPIQTELPPPPPLIRG